jgi:RNA polymerase sigma factor (sigma-70 family)
MIEEHYRLHYSALVKRANRTLKDYHHAEDCVQEAYKNAIMYLKTFDGTDFNLWFSTIFFNMLKKYWKEVYAKGMSQELKTKDHPLFPEEIVDRHYGLIKKEIEDSDLRDNVKQILFLFFLHGYRAKEIADFTTTPPALVNTYVSRFRKILLDKYEVNK